jgi:hypothetical protein
MYSARLLGCAALLVASVVSAEPFVTRDQNPLLGGSALPLPVPADLAAGHSTRFEIATNWSSTASSGLTGDEALLVDLESREVRLFVEHNVSDHFAIRVQLPYRQLTTGILDGFIDGWHRALGLPEGARIFLERDQFQVGYLRGSQTVLNRREPSQGLGDITLEAGRQVWKSPRASGAFWISLDAPTGSEGKLLGNGSWDAGVRLAGRNELSARNTAYWQIGATRMGRGGVLSQWQNDWAVSATGTHEFSATPSLHLKMQVDVHSALYKSGVDFLGEAAILTVGGEFRFDSGLRLEIGIGEDIKVGASPDVNFCFALRQSF